MRTRITVGLLAALVVGVVGPLQRAVSHESRTYYEVSGPLVPDGTMLAAVWAQSKRGAEASWQVGAGETRTYYSLITAAGDDAEAVAGTDRYSAKAAGDRRAILRVIACTNYGYTCSTRTWNGANTLTMDPLIREARFVGTLVDGAGSTCEIDGTWIQRAGHNVFFNDLGYPRARTRTAASLDLVTSCVGAHFVDGPGEAAMWTDHAAIAGR